MKLEPALAGALVAAQDQVTLPTSVTGISELFGDGARGVTGLANALYEAGVFHGKASSARRNVERWIKAEKGEGGQARHPSAQARAALDALAASRVDRATIRDIKRKGVHVSFSGEVVVSPGGKYPDARDKDIDAYIPGEQAGAFLDALIARRLDEAGDKFNIELMQAYGIGAAAIITDVEELSFTVGE
jgi:hypothetical protein